MVSILDGEVHRTWRLDDADGTPHRVVLYHDTITGVRCITVDGDEVTGSMGTSSVLNASMTIQFPVAGRDGVVLILRNGIFGFRYQCKVGGKFLKEANDEISATQPSSAFDVQVATHVQAASSGGEPVAWYLVKARREADGAATSVHRRYRDFAGLYESIVAGLKGHHAARLVPALPGKHLKLVIDHADPAFLKQRERALSQWLQSVARIPHVAAAQTLHTFLGLFEGTREVSLHVASGSIGCTLQASRSPNLPAIVTTIRPELDGAGVRVGDVLTKINGYATVGMGFHHVVETLRAAPRPLVLHFLQMVSAGNGEDGGSAEQKVVDGAGDHELEEKVKAAPGASPPARSAARQAAVVASRKDLSASTGLYDAEL